MKKIFGALMIAVCIGMAMPAQAQLHFGVKGGLNLSKASFSDVKENFKKDNFTGFFIGPMAEFNIPVVGLGVDRTKHMPLCRRLAPAGIVWPHRKNKRLCAPACKRSSCKTGK